MKLTADKAGNVRHFSAKLGWREKFDSREIQIITAGAVPMLIPPLAVQGWKNNIMQFDISEYSTLEYHLSCSLTREQFAEVLLQCIELLHQMKKIYLSYKNLVLDLDKVYVRLIDRSLHFIYLPLVDSKREVSIPDFFKLIVRKSAKSTYEQTIFLDNCTSWLTRPAPFALDEFETFILEQVQFAPAAQPISPSGEIKGAEAQPQTNERIYKPPIGSNRIMESDVVQTRPLSSGGEVGWTVLLGETVPKVRYYIQRIQTGQKIEITYFPFLVGTESGSVSYCISDNSAISRRHAEFSMKDGVCMVTDKGSTNKTYVNDHAIQPGVAQILQDGDYIKLANESFAFIREEQA